MGEKKLLCSVIIPTYNRESTILTSIDSVLKQTYKNIELIIVDDCSTDNTESIVKQIDDPRVKYFRLDKNHKACYARNYGFFHSKGEYVALNDSDDIWHINKVEKQIDYLESSKADFCFCGMNRIFPNGQRFYFPVKKVDTNEDFYFRELCENVVGTQTMLMKRDVFGTTLFDETFKRYQDWDFAIRVAKNYRCVYLNEALVDSYVQSDSITLNISDFEALDKLYNKYMSDISNNSRLTSSFFNKFGDSVRNIDNKRASLYYRKSFESKFNLKILFKCVFSTIGIRY